MGVSTSRTGIEASGCWHDVFLLPRQIEEGKTSTRLEAVQGTSLLCQVLAGAVLSTCHQYSNLISVGCLLGGTQAGRETDVAADYPMFKLDGHRTLR
jgi:hypothetical protein